MFGCMQRIVKSLQMDYKDFENKITMWANARGILHSENAHKQFMKFIEESGELSQAILKNRPDDIADAFGDVLVTLIILSKQLNYDLIKCLEIAYNEIKNREGKTVDGVFVKDE